MWCPDVLCHIDGPSGSGKTTLGLRLKEAHPGLRVLDLDENDDAAVLSLGWDGVRKSTYSDNMLDMLARKRQQLLDRFFAATPGPIVLVGIAREGRHVLRLQAAMRFLLDVDAETAAQRAYLRSQGEALEFRRTQDELAYDIGVAREDIAWLRRNGYHPASAEQIVRWVAAALFRF